MLRVMNEDGARGKDWLRARGASPVSYRHNFLVHDLEPQNAGLVDVKKGLT